MIEQVGFYETRGGELRYVVGRVPDGTTSSLQWAVCDSDGDIFLNMSSGHFYDETQQYEDDLVRYLPTVKSWDDPIPPADPPQYRPFCKDEFLPHSDRWLKDQSGDYFRITSIYINGVAVSGSFETWDGLHVNYQFDDGTPCGVQV